MCLPTSWFRIWMILPERPSAYATRVTGSTPSGNPNIHIISKNCIVLHPGASVGPAAFHGSEGDPCPHAMGPCDGWTLEERGHSTGPGQHVRVIYHAPEGGV